MTFLALQRPHRNENATTPTRPSPADQRRVVFIVWRVCYVVFNRRQSITQDYLYLLLLVVSWIKYRLVRLIITSAHILTRIYIYIYKCICCLLRYIPIFFNPHPAFFCKMGFLALRHLLALFFFWCAPLAHSLNSLLLSEREREKKKKAGGGGERIW